MLTQPNTETNIKLPFAFIFFSLASFVTSQLLVLWKGDVMLAGGFRQPILWAAAHLLLLGWALMAAMGSMYQLVPVAFLTPIWSERLGFVQFWVTACGITLFSVCLALSPSYSYVGGILTFIGILLFLWQMIMTLKSQAEKNVITLFVGTALLCLLTTIILGILLALNLGLGLPSLPHSELLKGHILLGLAGWFTLLIFGFSYKMVPMFSLAHGFKMGLSLPVYGTYVSGLVIALIALFLDYAFLFTIGLVILFAGFLLFGIHMRKIVNKRIKKKLDVPFIFSLIAILFGLAIHFLAVLYSIFSPSSFAFGTLALSYIMGWIVFSIVGYLIKIVPFLWWTHRYSQKVGKEEVPALKDMMDEKWIKPLLYFLPFSFSAVLVSFILQATSIFWIGQSLFTIGTIWFTFLILSVLKK